MTFYLKLTHTLARTHQHSICLCAAVSHWAGCHDSVNSLLKVCFFFCVCLVLLMLPPLPFWTVGTFVMTQHKLEKFFSEHFTLARTFFSLRIKTKRVEIKLLRENDGDSVSDLSQDFKMLVSISSYAISNHHSSSFVGFLWHFFVFAKFIKYLGSCVFFAWGYEINLSFYVLPRRIIELTKSINCHVLMVFHCLQMWRCAFFRFSLSHLST